MVSIVAVQPDSVLRLRYRLKRRQTVVALLGLRDQAGGFVGNFQIEISPTAVPSDANGWQQHEIPISSLVGKLSTSPHPPPDGRVFLVFIACYDPRPDLEVAEVAIESSAAPVLRGQ